MRSQENRGIQVRRTSDMEALFLDGPELREQETESTRSYLAVLWRRRWLMLAVAVAVLGLGMLYTFTRPPIYEASTRIVVVGSRPSTPVQETDVPLMGELQALTRSRSVETQLQIITSPSILQAAYEKLDPRIRAQGFESSTIPDWAYKVSSKKDTDIIEVTGRAYTPTAAAMLANIIADTYFERDQQQNNQATRQVREFTEKKMIAAQRELEAANAELARYKRDTGLFAPDTQLARAAEQVAMLSQALDEAKTQYAASEQEVEAIRRAMKSQQQDVVTNTTVTLNPQFSAISQKIDDLNRERAALLQEYTPQSREVKSIDSLIQAEEERLRDVAQTIVGSTTRARNPIRDSLLTTYANAVAASAANRARISSLESELEAVKEQTKVLPERERGLAERVEKVALIQRTHDMLSAKYYALLLREQATLPNGLLVSEARIPQKPALPSRGASIVLFSILGILLAVAVAMIAERFDQRIHDEVLVERLSGLPTLSFIPDAETGSTRIAGSASSGGPLLESFRILRNSLAFSGAEQRRNVLAITSPGRQEGKSTTSVNLATAMGMEGKRVLLVDADLRRPSLHSFLGVPRDYGLTAVIGGDLPMETAIHTTDIPNVYCMPAGPHLPDSAEMLGSQRCRDIFAALAEAYDAVVIDCPPTTGLCDVQSISRFADGMLLVVSMNRTLKPHLNFTIRMLMQADAPLLGVVINRIATNSGAYSYYYEYCDSSKDWDASDIRPVGRTQKQEEGLE